MKKVLLISPTRREYRELPSIADSLNCRIIYDDFAGDFFDELLSNNHQSSAKSLEILPLIEETIHCHDQSELAGVTSGVGYPGMPVSSIIAERLNLPGPRVDRVLLCEHKYYSRVAQQSLVPDATPSFALVDVARLDGIPDTLGLPFFLKPVKSCFSINADKIYSPEMFREKVKSCLLPQGFLKPLDDLLKTYTNFPLAASQHLLAESLLEGVQVSLEGYVFKGRVHILGIIDSVMYDGTISFKRFEYPSRLDTQVQERMRRIAEAFISGINYDNALFNIEFMYNPETGRIHIIEINPKIASQFTDLFEKVDGLSSYFPLLQIALGEEPVFPQAQGEFKVAASCVLRTFEDKRVLSLPSEEQIDALLKRFPDARLEIYASPGRLLSHVMQDGKSFRYGLINIGADSHAELEAKFELCQSLLDFEFAAPDETARP